MVQVSREKQFTEGTDRTTSDLLISLYQQQMLKMMSSFNV